MVHMLAIIGSGETSPSMVSIHRELAAALADRPAAVILETPYGFQENADAVSEKTVHYFAKNVGLDVQVAPGLRAPADGRPDLDPGIAMLRQADWVFAGPGSPTYAARQWRGSAVGQALRDRLAGGGVMIFASAAACAISRFALPVYEIYKVGMEPEWVEGLDLLSELGLVAAVIPHFDNAEGGTHDTRYCYVGERRLRQLEAQLPAEAIIFGVDEHTAAIFDMASETVTVRGRGRLTIRKQGHAEVIPPGASLGLAELRSLGDHTIAASPTTVAEHPRVGAIDQPGGQGAGLLGTARECEKRFELASGSRDAQAMVASILDLEAAIAAWSTDTLESGAIDDARAVLRSMVVRLGNAMAGGARDVEAEVAPIVEPLVSLREALRHQRRFEIADAIRDALAKAGIELQDTAEGSRWHRG